MRFIDSHTEGEPTRVLFMEENGSRTLDDVLRVWNDGLNAAAPLAALRALVANPRAPEACVGALLCRPNSTDADFGVFFFNASAALGMCGHGTIGVAHSLHQLGGMAEGVIRLETRAGIVEVRREQDNEYSFENIPSRVVHRDIGCTLHGNDVRGDIAYGGNEFFVVEEPRAMRSIAEELAYTRSIRDALASMHRTGLHGPIDHIALFLQPSRADAQERSFVLCPNDTFDRSPCGTGSSARLAVLAARGRLQPSEVLVIESAIGSRFKTSYRIDDEEKIRARIQGRAWITADGTMQRTEDPAHADGWREHTA